MTVKVMVHVPGVAIDPAGIMPALRLTEEAVLETTPPHWGVLGGEETVTPAGRLSVKDTPV